jgi:hypothetical protein
MAIDPKYQSGRGGFYDVTDGSGPYAIDSDGNATLIGAGGGGGGGTVAVSNFPAVQPVSGTVAVTGVATAALQTALNTAVGPATARAAVTDPAAAADANQLLRGILAAVNQIVINTTPTP